MGHPARVQPIKKFVNAKSRCWRVISALPFADAVVVFGGPPNPRVRRRPLGVVWTERDIAHIENGYDDAARVRARQYRHACLSAIGKAKLHLLGINAMHVDLTDLGRLEAFFDDVLQSAPAGKQRAIVSGSPQRVAAFIEAASTSLPDWAFHAAISGSRAERLEDTLKLIGAKRWYRLGDRTEDRLFRAAARIFRKRRSRVAR